MKDFKRPVFTERANLVVKPAELIERVYARELSKESEAGRLGSQCIPLGGHKSRWDHGVFEDSDSRAVCPVR